MKYTFTLLTMVILSAHHPLNAMVNLVIDDGDLVDRVNGNITSFPQQFRNLGEGTTYSDPTANEVTAFLAVFQSLYNGNYETAATDALAFDYRLVAFTDDFDNNTYYILERSPSSNANNYWGTYVFNPNPDRGQLVIQSSHPRYDFRTGKQGIFVFKQIQAAFFFVSGTHRCSSPTPSGCSGTSSVCANDISGESVPAEFSVEGDVFREGDVAHNEASMFQKATEWLHDQNPGYYFFIQLHGFGQNLAPHAILSNGRDEYTTPPQDDKLDVLRTQLILQWDLLAGHDDSLIIEVAHDDDDHNFNSLLATTNTQGRYINGRNNPCSQAANTNTGNFIHIEMASKNNDYFLREEVNFHILGTAIANTFLSAPLPVSLLSFEGGSSAEGINLSWETGWESQNSHFVVQRSRDGHEVFQDMALVAGHGTTTQRKVYQWRDEALPGDLQRFLYYRLKQVDFNGNYELSEVIGVELKRELLPQKLLNQNFGQGWSLKVNLPHYMRKEDEIHIWLIHLNSGQLTKAKVLATEVETTLRTWLSNRPPGLYQVKISCEGQAVSGKFLRL